MPVNANDVLVHFHRAATWLTPETADRFLWGDPGSEVRGIAVAWTATLAALREAGEKGLNLFITHEPAFYDDYRRAACRERLVMEKRALLEEYGIALVRIHDAWDRFPERGIPDQWVKTLGFPAEERPVESFYTICRTGGRSVGEVGRLVRERTRPWGGDWVLVLGDEGRRTERMVVGTGAITKPPEMLALGADVLLVTDDGVNTWDGGLLAADLGAPLLVVSHAVAEKPGMHEMAAYLREQFPGVPVEYLDVALPWRALRGGAP